MSRKKKKRKPTQQRRQKPPRMTPAGFIGIGIGLLLMGTGFYSALGSKEFGGFYVVVLGAAFVAAVAWGSLRGR